MQYLVACTCGHPLDRHTAAGCSGATALDACPCPHDAAAALDAAVDHAREHPWEGAPVPGTPSVSARRDTDAA